MHLQAIGHPVAGDPEYGTAGLLGLERQFLHATRLAFEHPITGEQIERRSPLPQDLRAALERAERRDPEASFNPDLLPVRERIAALPGAMTHRRRLRVRSTRTDINRIT